jgi:2-hydroxycyclohexanecarboxyl-CoA dehydrogenase
MRLDRKIAVVTGGASGIGRASVREAGGAADFVQFDITDEESIQALADEVLGRGEAPDVLVNAAGWDRAEPFLENSLEFMDRVVRLNLLGPVKLTKALVPAMIEAGAGKIVNVASDAGRVGSSGETVYAGAKGGIIAFTKSLAREMSRHGINVNCVCPGPTDTPLFHTLPERTREALVRAIPFRRLAKPEEVADAILFFASPRSDFITGQVLSVSGGLTMAG